MLVLKGGLEPPCLAAHEPESCVSTNFTTWAKQNRKELCHHIKTCQVKSRFFLYLSENHKRRFYPSYVKIIFHSEFCFLPSVSFAIIAKTNISFLHLSNYPSHFSEIPGANVLRFIFWLNLSICANAGLAIHEQNS